MQTSPPGQEKSMRKLLLKAHSLVQVISVHENLVHAHRPQRQVARGQREILPNIFQRFPRICHRVIHMNMYCISELFAIKLLRLFLFVF